MMMVSHHISIQVSLFPLKLAHHVTPSLSTPSSPPLRSYPYEANCTAEVEFATASYYPLNACRWGSVYTSCTGGLLCCWVNGAHSESKARGQKCRRQIQRVETGPGPRGQGPGQYPAAPMYE